MFMFTKKGYVPPVAAFRAATKDNREAFGIAVSIDNQIILEQGVLDWSNEEAAIKQLVDYAESYKEGAAMYWFSDTVVKTAQPYELFGMDVPSAPPDEKTIHQVFGVACFDGDFEKHDDDNSPETPEWNCFANLIKPRSEKIADEINKNLKEGEDPIDKFEKYINDDSKRTDAFTEGVMSETSSFCLLIVDTLFMNFEGSSAPGKGYAWGYMSNPYSYVEMPNKQGSVPVVKPKAVGTLVPKGKSVTAEIDKVVGAADLIPIHPPKKIVKTTKDLVEWYQTWNYAKAKDGKGIVPENFQGRPAVEVERAKWDATFSGKVPTGVTATAVPPTAGLVTKKNSSQTTTEPKPFVPVMSAQELAKLTEGWLKHGYINPNITTGKSLAAEDYKIPTFAEQTGVSLSDLAKQSPESINYLVERHPTLATNLIMELIRMNISGQKILSVTTTTSQPKAGLLVPKVKAA